MHDLIRTLHHRIVSRSLPLLEEQEALELVRLPDRHTLDMLGLANMARSVFGPAAGARCGIINAKSGRCPEDCAFCAQSVHHHTGSPVYPLTDSDTLLRRAEVLAEAGATRFGIVTSGTEVSERDLDALCESALRISREVNIGLCASLGLMTVERARRLKEAGFSRYHHNLETAASHFSAICTTHRYEEDLESLRAAGAAGLELCSCGIFGLGESREQRVELGLTLAKEGVDSLAVNFLRAIAGTRLEAQPKLAPSEALRAIALMRLLNPTRDIVICGGREHVLGEWQPWLFAAGASRIMTGDYLTTKGQAFAADNAMLAELGLTGEKA